MEQICNPIFDITIHAFDTSSAVRLRSSPYLIPDRILSCLFRDAHHLDSLSTQLTAVWRLLLEVVAGGPASIFLTVANKTYLLSWHTRPVRAEFPHTVPQFQLFDQAENQTVPPVWRITLLSFRLSDFMNYSWFWQRVQCFKVFNFHPSFMAPSR